MKKFGDGSKRWYNNKKQLHREDGPAVIHENGTKHWFINGKEHRLDGPASEYSDGTQVWSVNGELHREDGPAVIDKEYLEKEWYQKGKLHRLDGPAVERENGENEYWINGEKVSEEDIMGKKYTIVYKKCMSQGSSFTVGKTKRILVKSNESIKEVIQREGIETLDILFVFKGHSDEVDWIDN